MPPAASLKGGPQLGPAKKNPHISHPGTREVSSAIRPKLEGLNQLPKFGCRDFVLLQFEFYFGDKGGLLPPAALRRLRENLEWKLTSLPASPAAETRIKLARPSRLIKNQRTSIYCIAYRAGH